MKCAHIYTKRATETLKDVQLGQAYRSVTGWQVSAKQSELIFGGELGEKKQYVTLTKGIKILGLFNHSFTLFYQHWAKIFLMSIPW